MWAIHSMNTNVSICWFLNNSVYNVSQYWLVFVKLIYLQPLLSRKASKTCLILKSFKAFHFYDSDMLILCAAWLEAQYFGNLLFCRHKGYSCNGQRWEGYSKFVPKSFIHWTASFCFRHHFPTWKAKILMRTVKKKTFKSKKSWLNTEDNNYSVKWTPLITLCLH